MIHGDRDPEAGVTLIEMLVAVAICALIGLAGFGMLDTILRVNERVEDDLDRYADLDRAFFVLGRDLLAADAAGVALENGILGVQTGEGRELSYDLDGSLLLRRIGSPPVEQTLVDGVAEAEWRVLDAQGEWRDIWQKAAPDAPRPRAVELRLDLSAPREGRVRRLFLLTPGSTP